MNEWKYIGRAALACGVLALAWPGASRADDPLDEKDGTEDWEQVVDAPARSHKSAPPPKDLVEIRRELGEYQQWRNAWDADREEFIRERTRHRMLSERYLRDRTRREAESRPPEKAHAIVPDRSLDRLLNEELGESGKTPARGKGPDRPAQAPASAAAPPSAPVRPAAPLPETAPANNDSDWGGSTFASPSDDEEVKAAAKFLKEQREREEAQRRIEEERKQKQAAEEARKKREEEEAAAAAMRLLKQQEEELKKEQENLRKKANLKTDDEGQVVDPDLQKEQGE